MRHPAHLLRRALGGSALPALLLAAGAALAQPPAVRHVSGVIESETADSLTVTTRGGGTAVVGITDATPVVAVSPTEFGAIKPGSYIGTAAVPGPGGTLRATEVHVFSEAMRGVGEGHTPWYTGPDSTMTNGTVGEVAGSNGRTLRVTYKGGEQSVTVDPETPVVSMERGTHALLTKGAHVSISALPGDGGALKARFVVVGKDGFEPPL